MSRLGVAGRQTFRSLRTRNFRLYFAGQVISASGSWMQQVAQVWLVLKLTDSGFAVGALTALQFLPVLVGGAWAGVVADRMDKRRLMVGTASVSIVLAATLGVLVVTGVVQVWMVFVLAGLLGCVTALDSPARRAFVTELVSEQHEANAVSLNSSVFTAARVIGPALAGTTIAAVGIAWCFFANAISFLAVIGALLAMRPAEIRPATPLPRRRGQLVEGLRYVWGRPALRITLLMTAVIGTLSFNFQVTLSLLAKQVFHGGAGDFGLLYSLMSVGALGGSLVVAHRERAGTGFVVGAAVVFGALMLALSAAPTAAVAEVVLVPMGAASIAFLSAAGALSQTRAEPVYRGRVAALFAVAFLGSTPIGGPIVGGVSQVLGPRAGLVLGGTAALAAGSWAITELTRRRREERREPSAGAAVAAA